MTAAAKKRRKASESFSYEKYLIAKTEALVMQGWAAVCDVITVEYFKRATPLLNGTPAGDAAVYNDAVCSFLRSELAEATGQRLDEESRQREQPTRRLQTEQGSRTGKAKGR